MGEKVGGELDQVAKKREQERRAQILWAAIECVAELGIEGATMKKVAERAGVSTGMITYYFADKNDLIKNALAFGHQQVGERSRQLREGDKRRAFLPALFEVSILEDSPAVPPLSFWIEYWAHASRDPDLKDFRAARISRFRQTIAESLRQAVNSGRFRAGLDPLLAADMLQALLDGLQLKVALDSATISPDRAMEVVEFLLHLLESGQTTGAHPAGSLGARNAKASVPRARAGSGVQRTTAFRRAGRGREPAAPA